jgi:hypothetical protein
VIIRDEVGVAAPVAAVDAALRRYLVDGALDTLASDATADGQAVAIRPGRALLAKQVAVQVAPSVVAGTRLVYAMRWTATGPTGELFPTLDANLELDAVDGAEGASTRLVLIGSYVPPFGRLGEVVDHVLLHAVASATVRSFLTRVQHLATSPQPSPQESSPVWTVIPDAAGDWG